MAETNEVKNYVRAFSYCLAFYKNELSKAVRNWYAQMTTDENLLVVGRDRRVGYMPGEDIDRYRLRVIDAYNENLGRGSLENIKVEMFAIGYIFNSTVSGTPGPEGRYNILIRSLGFVVFDGTYIYDGSINHDAPGPNDIVFELIQAAAITPEQIETIRETLDPVIRASSRITTFIRIDPA